MYNTVVVMVAGGQATMFLIGGKSMFTYEVDPP